jgi:hypothetical protein
MKTTVTKKMKIYRKKNQWGRLCARSIIIWMKIVAIVFSNAQGSKSAGVNLEKEKALLEGCNISKSLVKLTYQIL